MLVKCHQEIPHIRYAPTLPIFWLNFCFDCVACQVNRRISTSNTIHRRDRLFSYVGALHYRFSKGLSYAKHTAEGFPRRRFFYSQLPAKPYTMSFTCTTTSNCTFTATFSRLQLESEDGGCSNAPVYAPASLATTNITVAIRYPTSGSSPSPLHPASPTRIAVFELAVNGPLRYVNGSCLVSRQRRRYPYAATSRL